MQGEKQETNTPKKKVETADLAQYGIGADLDKLNTTKRNLVKAMISTMGIVTQACSIAKVSRTSYYNYLDREHQSYDPEFAEIIETITEYQYDFAESKILKKIQEEDTTMLIFYAKTKMKHRGYVERTEIAPVESVKTHVYYPETNEIPYEDLTDDAGDQSE